MSQNFTLSIQRFAHILPCLLKISALAVSATDPSGCEAFEGKKPAIDEAWFEILEANEFEEEISFGWDDWMEEDNGVEVVDVAAGISPKSEKSSCLTLKE